MLWVLGVIVWFFCVRYYDFGYYVLYGWSWVLLLFGYYGSGGNLCWWWVWKIDVVDGGKCGGNKSFGVVEFKREVV